MIVEIPLFFDYNEYYIKEEGFYPQITLPKTGNQFSKIFIKFSLRNNAFEQNSGPAISGFYENYGEDILKELNNNFNTNIKYIVNFGGRVVHPTYFENSTFKIITKGRCFSI